MKKEIKAYLAPLRRKIALNTIITVTTYALLTSVVLAFILVLLSRFVVIVDLYKYLSVLFFATLIISLGLILWRLPSWQKTVLTADNLALDQRLITAWSSEQEQSEYLELLSADLRQQMQSVKIEQLYKLKINYRLLALTLLILVAGYSVNLWQTEQSLVAEISRQEQLEIQTIAEDLREKLSADLDKISEAEAKAAAEKLAELLENNLAQSKDKLTALKDISISKSELSKLKEKYQLEESDSKQLIEIESRLTEAERQLGKKSLQQIIADSNQEVGLLKLAGKNEPLYFITFNNFSVITTYNTSPMYAMAVFNLAKSIESQLTEHHK